MKSKYIIIIITLLVLPLNLHLTSAQTLDYSMNFSTYIGGTTWENIRGMTTDPQGYIYITGGTYSADYPTTFGPPHAAPPCPTQPCACITNLPNGWCSDVFVTKLTPDGQQIVWSRLIGTTGHDRGYGVKYDPTGYILIHGRMGPGYSMTPGVVQPTFGGWGMAGVDGYGPENGFVGKIYPNNGSIVWISYIGSDALVRDATTDEFGNVYVTTAYNPSLSPWRPDQQYPAAFVNAYRKTPYSGADLVIFKISPNGTQILWATYFGGSGNEGGANSIGVHWTTKNVYVSTSTTSTDLPGTSSVFSQGRNAHGAVDYFVAKISSDGSSLLWAAYLGGSSDEFHNTQNLVVEQSTGDVFVTPSVCSSNYPTTVGAFQTTFGGGNNDIAISKISSDGTTLLASTFVGGSSNDNSDGLVLDTVNHRIYFTGNTGSTNFPVTANAYQSTNKGGTDDGFVAVMSDNLTQLLYSTYIGGSGDDGCRAATVDVNGNFLCGGASNSNNFPVLNAIQPTYTGVYKGIVVKFSPSSSCGDRLCDPGETCSYDNCCNGQLYNPLTQVCCFSSLYTGNCCSDLDCTSPQTCNLTTHTCQVPPQCENDQDNDQYGVGPSCLDLDCDDNNPNIHASITCPYNGAQCGSFSLCQSTCPAPPSETCTNGIDDDCDSLPDCQDPDCSSHSSCLPSPCTGLVLLHHYDNQAQYGESATNIYDFSGNGNNGTMQYNAFINTTAGKFSGAAQFDGTNDNVNAGNKPSLNPANQITISAWVNSFVGGKTQVIVEKTMAASPWTTQYLCRLQNAGGTTNYVRAGVNSNFLTPAIALPINQWHHVVCAYNGSTLSIYVDGSLWGTPLSVSTAMYDVGVPVRIGDFEGGGLTFNGSIDELAIWNRSLSSQEIQSLYSSSSPIYCQTCIHKSDNNPCDGKVCMNELLAFINRWKYNNQDVNLRELIDAIGLYNKNKGC